MFWIHHGQTQEVGAATSYGADYQYMIQLRHAIVQKYYEDANKAENIKNFLDDIQQEPCGPKVSRNVSIMRLTEGVSGSASDGTCNIHPCIADLALLNALWNAYEASDDRAEKTVFFEAFLKKTAQVFEEWHDVIDEEDKLLIVSYGEPDEVQDIAMRIEPLQMMFGEMGPILRKINARNPFAEMGDLAEGMNDFMSQMEEFDGLIANALQYVPRNFLMDKAGGIPALGFYAARIANDLKAK